MKSNITKIAAAAVIIVALALIISLSSSFEGKAFAQIAEKLRTSRTMIYKTKMNTGTEVDMTFKEPGHMRIIMPDGYVTVADWTKGIALSTMPSRKQYVQLELSGMTGEPAMQQFKTIEELRSLPEKADEYLGTVEEKGMSLQGFRVTKNDVISTVWIDKNTKNLVRIESKFINAPGMNLVMTDFQFDIELDDSIFSLTPPDGYTPMNIKVNSSELMEKDLIEFLQIWASWTKDHSFPPTLNPMEIQKLSMDMEQQGKFNPGETSEQKRMQDAMIMARGIMFITQLPAESNWRYAGENVIQGDSNTAVFWYRPQGSQSYRVIYGDLTVKTVSPENLPK